MLKLAIYEKRKFIGLYMYSHMIMTYEPLKLKESNTTMYICTYDITDSSDLRKYIGYFKPYNNNCKLLTLESYKHLPIKPEDKNA